MAPAQEGRGDGRDALRQRAPAPGTPRRGAHSGRHLRAVDEDARRQRRRVVRVRHRRPWLGDRAVGDPGRHLGARAGRSRAPGPESYPRALRDRAGRLPRHQPPRRVRAAAGARRRRPSPAARSRHAGQAHHPAVVRPEARALLAGPLRQRHLSRVRRGRGLQRLVRHVWRPVRSERAAGPAQHPQRRDPRAARDRALVARPVEGRRPARRLDPHQEGALAQGGVRRGVQHRAAHAELLQRARGSLQGHQGRAAGAQASLRAGQAGGGGVREQGRPDGRTVAPGGRGHPDAARGRLGPPLDHPGRRLGDSPARGSRPAAARQDPLCVARLPDRADHLLQGRAASPGRERRRVADVLVRSRGQGVPVPRRGQRLLLRPDAGRPVAGDARRHHAAAGRRRAAAHRDPRLPPPARRRPEDEQVGGATSSPATSCSTRRASPPTRSATSCRAWGWPIASPTFASTPSRSVAGFWPGP